MAYIGDDKAVMFSGSGYQVGRSADTWIYDLSDDSWVEVFPPPGPAARHSHAIAYLGDDKAVMFGGFTGSGQYINPLDDTWVYDRSDNTWNEVTGTPHPSARYGHAMCQVGGNDPHTIVMFGGSHGSDGVNQITSKETWTFGAP
jgi:N-acetylneuraminic acid mutarotase